MKNFYTILIKRLLF